LRNKTYDIALAPRHVPSSVFWRVLIGGWSGQLGWGLVGFGGLFALIFAGNADCMSWYYFRSGIEVQTVTGTVTGMKKTGFSTGGSGRRRGGSSRRGKPIYEVRYRYNPTADIPREGASYVTATSSTSEPTVPPDVIVEYPANRPDISRIQGMRRRPFHGALGLIALIPGAGLLIALRALRRGMISAELLRRGRPAGAKLLNKRMTGAQINKQTVWALTFEYATDEGMKYQTVVKTHHEEQLLDEAQERLLYDPVHPSRAVLLDSLPGTPGLDESGNIRPVTAGAVAAALILPLIGLGMMAATGLMIVR